MKGNVMGIELKKTSGAESALVARRAASILIEKKAKDVSMYEVGKEHPITDFYINVTGRSLSHVGSLADELSDKLSEEGISPMSIEGRRGDGWILVDYGDVIVNVFDKESREFYNLDRLMPEKTIVDISDIISEVDKKLNINNTEG